MEMELIGKKFNDFFLRCYRTSYSYSIQYNLPLFKRPSMPHYIQLELTNDCNMKCSHCSRQRLMDNRPVAYMDFQLFKKIIDELRGYPQCFVRIGGLGEQSLHPEFEDMLHYLKEHRIRFEIVTNGLLLTKFTPQSILDSGVEILGVSIDGNDPVSYAQKRPGGDYNTIRKKVINFYLEKKRSHKKLPELQIRNVIFPDSTSDQIGKFKEDWKPYADFVRFNTLIPDHDEVSESPKRCTEINFTIHIRSDGKVPLCGYQHWYSEVEWIGDLQKDSIRNIWKSNRLDELRKAHHIIDLNDFQFCKRCFKTQHGDACLKNIVKWNEHRNPVISRIRALTKNAVGLNK